MKKIKIIVGICSHYNGQKRRDIIRQTWLRYGYNPDEVLCLFFVGGGVVPDDNQNDIVTLGSNDSYSYLPEKCFDFYNWCLRNYDFEHIFKCDDDTFLAVDRILELPDKNYDLVGDPCIDIPDRLAPSGGAGYLMSRPLVDRIIHSRVPSTGAEDLVFGHLTQSLGYKCKADSRLCMDSSKKPLQTNSLISCHWCNEELMQLCDRMYTQQPLLEMKGRHEHWEDNLCIYEEGLAIQKHRGGTARITNHGGGLISVDWHSWEKELLRRKNDHSYKGTCLELTPISSVTLDEVIKPTGNYWKQKPKAALLITSYKRFDHLVRQIFSMLGQSYEHKHVFAAVKGVSEYFFQTAVVPLFSQFIEQGLLTLKHFPNKNQFSNLMDTIREENLSQYDLFFKIDDDDFYAPSYVADCCKFHMTLPMSWSSFYEDVHFQLLSTGNDHPHLTRRSYSAMFGNTFVISRELMEFLVKCERDPRLMHPVSARWDGGTGHHSYGFTEDHFFHIAMKELGCKNRASHVQDNHIPLHLITNKVVPSVTRKEGTLQEDFKEKNWVISNDPALWEHILDLQTPRWTTAVRILGNKGKRLDNEQEFTVLQFDSQSLELKWHSGETGVFEKIDNGKFLMKSEK